jgi:hypothetical protein
MARSFHFSTGTGAPTAQVIVGASDFLALFASSAEAANYYVKFWWSGNTTNAPVIGTTKPSLTIPVPISGQSSTLNFPLNNGGLLYVWVTAGGADTDATALTAGSDAITIVFD